MGPPLAPVVINTGLKAWSVVRDGSGSASASAAFCNALPKGASPTRISGGRSNRHRFTDQWRNGWGETVASCTYSVEYRTGVHVPDNEGEYIADCGIIPDNPYAYWGFTYDASVTVQGLVNMASRGQPPRMRIDMILQVNLRGFQSMGYAYRVRVLCGRGGVIVR